MNSNDSDAPGASSRPEEAPLPGWYGKIPCLGDFVSRRLPAAFIDAWDAWLQRGMAKSRAVLGEGWLDAYLTGPIWRFALQTDTCGNAHDIWTGVLMPSVDRVGRYFPLTIAQRIDPRPGALPGILAAQAWYTALEQAALAMLDVDARPEDLDRNLASHPFPIPRTVDECRPVRELAQWWTQPDGPGILALPSGQTLEALFEAAARNAFEAAGRGKSLWWSVPADAPDTTRLLCCRGLPSEDRFTAMLDPNGMT